MRCFNQSNCRYFFILTVFSFTYFLRSWLKVIFHWNTLLFIYSNRHSLLEVVFSFVEQFCRTISKCNSNNSLVVFIHVLLKTTCRWVAKLAFLLRTISFTYFSQSWLKRFSSVIPFCLFTSNRHSLLEAAFGFVKEDRDVSSTNNFLWHLA